jgi:hypothetical protein
VEQVVSKICERCGAIDVHKKILAVCSITPDKTETVIVGTTTREIEQLMDYLEKKGIKHVAMESTGSYWKPVYNLLETRGFEVTLVNARQFKNAPGRKTDIQDAQWLAGLLQMGLLTASYVPSRATRTARSDSLLTQPDRRTNPGNLPNPKRLRRWQYQVEQCSHRHYGQVRSCHTQGGSRG